MNSQAIITLPDGYNGHTARFYATPIETDGNLVKLRCAEVGKGYLIRWTSKLVVKMRLEHEREHVATVLP